MKSVAKTLREMVNYLSDREQNKDSAIKTIIHSNHPIFRSLAVLTRTPYRIFFTNRDEMETWLKARSWNKLSQSMTDIDSFEEWENERIPGYIKFTQNFFDEHENLIVVTEQEWDDNSIQYVKVKEPVDDIQNFETPDFTDPFAD